MTPLHDLTKLGQSIWIDHLSRAALRGGELARMIEQDAVVGVTSNPTIFEQAMATGDAYESQLRELLDAGVQGTAEIFWALAQRDVQEACDLLAPVWERSGCLDGWVSLEVDPALAYDAAGTLAEATRLRAEVDRPNLMIKIPATEPGLAAFEDAIAAGMSVNVTLIFSLARYVEVAEAYLRGLERLLEAGADPGTVASVASFFISRIDLETDRRLEAIGDPRGLRGRLAIANAKLAYQHFMSVLVGLRWRALAAQGAMPQRLLWASTSTKDPAYPATRYVDELAGPNTVNTMPVATLSAYREQGHPEARLEHELTDAGGFIGQLARAGVDYDDVTATLERDGVTRFVESFRNVLASLEGRIAAAATA